MAPSTDARERPRPDWDRVKGAMLYTGLDEHEVQSVIRAGYPVGRRSPRRTNWHRVAAAMEAVQGVSATCAAVVLGIHRTREKHCPVSWESAVRIAHRYLLGPTRRPAADPRFEAAFCWCVPVGWALRIGVEARAGDRTKGYDRASRDPEGSCWVPPRADRIRLLRWAGEEFLR